MGYVVRKLNYKKGPGWKVMFEDRSKKDRKSRDIPRDQWKALGFDPAMRLEEAQKVRDFLNSQEAERRHAEKRVAIQARIEKEDEIECVFLLPMDVAEFEKRYLYVRPDGRNSKIGSNWRATKRMIRKLQLPPEEWFEMKHVFYDYFAGQQISPAYAHKVLRIANLWGHFISRKRKTAFLPVPSPKGRDAQQMADAYFDKSEDGRVSKPLTPALLEKAEQAFVPNQYAWLSVTVWLGLRPDEADHFNDPKRTKIEADGVHVYQSKLRSVARSKRWKIIPLRLPEQVAAVELAKKGVKRPLNKTIKSHLADGITGYGGRKNFTDMMLDRGFALEDISIWLGHATIERTWRSYKDRQRSKRAA